MENEQRETNMDWSESIKAFPSYLNKVLSFQCSAVSISTWAAAQCRERNIGLKV